MRIRTLGLLTLVLTIAACGGEAASTTTIAATTTSTMATTSSEVTTTTTAATTTTSAATTTSRPIDVFYEGGQVVGPDRVTVSVGEDVSVWVLSDTDEEIHVHGYDLIFPAKARVPVEVTLTADVPGIFEVELESSHTPLFEIEATS